MMKHSPLFKRPSSLKEKNIAKSTIVKNVASKRLAVLRGR